MIALRSRFAVSLDRFQNNHCANQKLPAKTTQNASGASFFAIDLFQAAQRLQAPVYFLEGRQDRVVTGESRKKYFNALEAPRGKQLIWFEQSAHWPQLEEPEKFNEVIVNRVLRENHETLSAPRA